jgi:3-hydroxyacyl-[acyl-carrier-protein] dehydratase
VGGVRQFSHWANKMSTIWPWKGTYCERFLVVRVVLNGQANYKKARAGLKRLARFKLVIPMRFSLVDRIIELAPGESVTAIKNVSLAEEYLADHFPGYPVLPGVMMLECLVQTGAWLMRTTEDFRYSTILLKQAKALKYNNFVRPGQTLKVTATVHSRGEKEYVFKGTGTVDGGSAVSARVTLEQFNLSERNPDLEVSDRKRIEQLRRQFAEIWTPPPLTGTAI